jgi:UTP pyrophosphatase
MHALLRQRYPEPHAVRDDKALFEHVNALKQRHLRHAPPLASVRYDAKLRLLQQALGTHTRSTRVQGGQLKARRDIRIATLFRDLPAAFLDMIVVHELAHLREPEHDKAFYALCTHLLGDYHQCEFDLRLWLAADALAGAAPGATAG